MLLSYLRGSYGGGESSSGKDSHFKEKPGSQEGGIMVPWDKGFLYEVMKGTRVNHREGAGDPREDRTEVGLDKGAAHPLEPDPGRSS